MATEKILLLEPYYGGSHKVLMDLLLLELDRECVLQGSANHPSPVLITMTGKKWHWRARTSALHLAEIIPRSQSSDYSFRPTFKTIFASSVLPLHELIALRSDLRDAKKILYFHENQLVYPVRKVKGRDFQYGYNQILSCLAADVVLFNSEYNKLSFLDSIKTFFKLQPDYRPKNLREQIQPKCKVLYFPMDFSAIIPMSKSTSTLSTNDPVKIVWPHRWEFDKNPDLFFRVLYRLVDEGCNNFRLSILGEHFHDNPPIFDEARLKLASHVDNFGYLPSKTEYYKVLQSSDVVVSTADHEFFGVAIVEAIYCGCYPLCPNRLVYPEILNRDKKFLFDTEDELFKKLRYIISNPEEFRKSTKSEVNINMDRFDWTVTKKLFCKEILD